MEKKICTRCEDSKELDDFSWKSKVKGTKQSKCKVCMRELDKIKYANDTERRRRIRETAKLAYIRNRDFVRRVKRLGSCSECVEDRWYCLDFHHCGDKEFELSDMVHSGYSIIKIKKEIRKCKLLCANCHREEHYQNGY